jgi:toxin YoeB
VRLVWDQDAWEDYRYWQRTDRAKVKRINDLIRAILREPFSGPGKPEPLKHQMSGSWSRRIDDEHRLVYAVEPDEITIISCRYHYE